MDDSLNRRDWLRVLGISGVAAGLSSLRAGAAAGQESGFQSSIVNSNEVQANRASPSLKSLPATTSPVANQHLIGSATNWRPGFICG